MKSVKLVYSTLSPKERLVFCMALLMRFVLGLFDVAGVALVGLSVSMVSGVSFMSGGLGAALSDAIWRVTPANPYAVVACLAVAFFILKAVLAITINKIFVDWVARVESNVSARIFTGYLRANLSQFSGENPKRLAHGLVHGTHLLFGNMLVALSTAVTEFSMIVILGTYMFFVSAPAFFITAAYFGLFGWVMYSLVNRRNRGLWRAQEMAHVGAQTSIQDATDNFRQIWSLARQPYFSSKFENERETIAKIEAKLAVSAQLPRYLTEIAIMGGVGLLLAVRSASSGLLSASVIAVFLTGAFRIIASMLPLQAALSSLKDVEAGSIEIMRMIESYIPLSDVRKTTSSPRQPTNEIRIRNLSAAYSASGVTFSGLNACFPRGSRVAVVGESGSGKSTFLDLLIGLRLPVDGEIKYEGLDIAEFVKSHPGAIAYAPQRMFAITGTLRDNLTFGLEGQRPSDESLLELLEIFNLKTLFGETHNVLDHKMSYPSGGLSGGQLQRVGLIRAIISSPEVLVLDEVTSGLDGLTTSSVLTAIDTLARNCTLFFATHDESLLGSFDYVVRFAKDSPPQVSSRERVEP